MPQIYSRSAAESGFDPSQPQPSVLPTSLQGFQMVKEKRKGLLGRNPQKGHVPLEEALEQRGERIAGATARVQAGDCRKRLP